MSVDPAHIRWCRQTFDLLVDGGIFGIPRSGIVWRRKGDTLVLDSRMPWSEEMQGVITPEQLQEQQDGEIEASRRHFEAAGIPVITD